MFFLEVQGLLENVCYVLILKLSAFIRVHLRLMFFRLEVASVPIGATTVKKYNLNN